MLTAAAWLHFSISQVDIAVVEVGLGGRLDATNVVNAPLVQRDYLPKSRQHWQRLGPTLAHIRRRKSRHFETTDVQRLIGPLPPAAQTRRSQATDGIGLSSRLAPTRHCPGGFQRLNMACLEKSWSIPYLFQEKTSAGQFGGCDSPPSTACVTRAGAYPRCRPSFRALLKLNGLDVFQWVSLATI